MPSNVDRQRLVDGQLRARNIRDPLVLDAMGMVPREVFVSPDHRHEAYEDRPLPIGSGQTISQPYIVGLMIEALGLSGGEKVLEIGAGSGYAAAVLAQIAGAVYTVERIAELAALAARNLKASGCRNVHVRLADGTMGWSDEAPFDAILVSAGAPDIPQSLVDQLRIGGVMVVPVGGERLHQELIKVTRTGDATFERTSLGKVSFVPLIGKEGWRSSAGSRC